MTPATTARAKRPIITATKNACRGRWREILSAVMGIPRELLDSKHHACPKCGGKDRFRAHDDVDETGGVICNQCHSPGGGDGFNTVGWFLSLDFKESLRVVAEHIGEAAFDLPEKHQNSKRSDKPKPRITATYDYLNAAGKLVHQTVRYEPKEFKQRRPNESGNGWIWSLKNIETVLYRLPEIISSSLDVPVPPIVIVEGEKDADNVVSKLQHIATTCPMGAGKWKDSYTLALKGRDVIIVGDIEPPRDDGKPTPGRQHVVKVANELHGVAHSVRVVELPNPATATSPILQPKWDISDWIESGGTREIFDAAVTATATWNPDDHQDELPSDTHERTPIKNFFLLETRNEDGESKVISKPLPISEIAEQTLRATGGWPKRMGVSLFVRNENRNDISWLVNTDALFGYLGHATSVPPQFTASSGYHTKKEFFSHLTRTVADYAAIETLPHEPLISGHFYACEDVTEGDGEALRELVNRFTPETDIDRDLILAAFVTPFWGGQGGTRPAFCITSDVGKGCGKSTLAACIGQLAGGAVDVSANEDVVAMKSRLLSSDGLTRRVVWLDNIKSFKLSWAELESLITTPTISGKRLFVGEGQRPNNIVYVLTMNGVSLSSDLAQRSVLIKLARPAYSGTWAEDTRQFIESHRSELIADIIAFLRSPCADISGHSRWGEWERSVLSRLPEPAEAQKVIKERRGVVDVDTEESALIEDFFDKMLTHLGYDTESNRVFIPSSIAARWLCKATNENHSVAKSSRLLKQKITEGQFQRLSECPNRHHGRGFEFWGSEATGSTYLMLDIDEQIKNRGESHLV